MSSRKKKYVFLAHFRLEKNKKCFRRLQNALNTMSKFKSPGWSVFSAFSALLFVVHKLSSSSSTHWLHNVRVQDKHNKAKRTINFVGMLLKMMIVVGKNVKLSMPFTNIIVLRSVRHSQTAIYTKCDILHLFSIRRR